MLWKLIYKNKWIGIPGIGERGDKGEWWRGDSTMTYCKNFCKCHNVHPVQQ
jgi:hypothetical protein